MSHHYAQAFGERHLNGISNQLTSLMIVRRRLPEPQQKRCRSTFPIRMDDGTLQFFPGLRHTYRPLAYQARGFVSIRT